MEKKVNRFERKWIYKANEHLTLVNALIRSNLFFYKQYPDRRVNSIYFDDINCSSIIENLDGVSQKKKIRIRWDGEKSKLINPMLEIKSKKGFETNKKTYQINELNDLTFKNFKNLELIKNIVDSGSVYFASTTYPKITKNQKPINKDRWRQLNLTLPPFSLPEPIKYLDDSCPSISLDADKCIGVWRIEDLFGYTIHD